MWKLKGLMKHCNEIHANINEKWVPARPLSLGGIQGFWWRFKDAWQVLRGKADAFKWPEGQ